MSIEHLAREEILRLKPYEAAAHRPGSIRLNANEAPCPLNPERPLNRYPEVRPVTLQQRLAEYYGQPPERLLATRGSSEAIDLLVRVFCRPHKDSVLVAAPTFGMYRVYAEIQGARVLTAVLDPERDFAFEADAALALCEDETRLIFLCNPNNPTGSRVDPAAIRRLARAREGRSLIVVDEAYAEFSGEPSALELVDDHENLVVLRTLSKGLSLAGVRCGAVIGAPALTRLLTSILAPYAFAGPVVECVLEALGGDSLLAASRMADSVVLERQRLAAQLAACDAVERVWPSDANFLLLRFRDMPAVRDALADENILIRELGADAELPNCARVTVGLPEENNRLVAALAGLHGKPLT